MGFRPSGLGVPNHILPASHDKGPVLSSGAALSLGRRGVAMGAGADVASGVSWGLWRGSSCGVESSLAPLLHI